MDAPTIDDLTRTKYGKSFNKMNLIRGKEDTASLFPRGYYYASKDTLDKAFERIQSVAEGCENLQGFNITHAISGGCGSGFTAALMRKLHDEFPKTKFINHTLMPSPKISTSVVEVYNSVLSIPSLLEYSSLCVMYDNEAMYKAYMDAAGSKATCSYVQANRLIAQVASSMTAAMRFTDNNDSSWSLDHLVTNSVAHEQQHFVAPSLSPLIATNNMWSTIPSVSDMTDLAFKPVNTLHSLNREKGKYISCCSIYRGGVPVDDIGKAIAEHQPGDRKTKKTKNWVEGVPRGFKGVVARKSSQPFEDEPINVADRSLCMLTNHTGLASTLQTMCEKFGHVYAKRAFVFWYVGEGMEEVELTEARDVVEKLKVQYEAM
jgi:tubulin alpha